MKNQLNRMYIFFTFRGQLILLLAFISINLFNVVNYAYTEGCGNLMGESVGLYVKLKEDPTFEIEQLSAVKKAYLLEQYNKEKTALEGQPLLKKMIPTPQEQVLPKNPMPLSTPEPPHSLPKVIPDKINTPLLVYPYDEEGSNLNQILADIKNGGAPVHKAHERKFINILTELNKLELKYKNAGMDQHEAMVTDIHKIFVDPHKATAIHYPNIHQIDLPSNKKFFVFQEEFLGLYFASNGNPLVLEAITVYNKNISMYNELLLNGNFTSRQEIACYNDLRGKFLTIYKKSFDNL